MRIEVFVSIPPCSGGLKLLRVVDEMKAKYGDALDIEIHRCRDANYERYGISSAPALVIEEIIRLMGFCPSVETFENALREMGAAAEIGGGS